LAVLKIATGGVALRPGFSGFADVQYSEPGGFWPAPGKGPILFRGHFELAVALSAERLAREWLGEGGAVEVVLALGHESDHVLGSGGPDSGFVSAPRPGDIVDGGGGNFVIYELALRRGLTQSIEFWTRLVDRAFFQGSPVQNVPGAEAGLRWRWRSHFQPVLSLYGEALLVDPGQNLGRDGADVDALAGIALPGAFGELIPYASLQVGNQKGLLINHREADVILGVRYAPF
jgi:hypothetical protein